MTARKARALIPASLPHSTPQYSPQGQASVGEQALWVSKNASKAPMTARKAQRMSINAMDKVLLKMADRVDHVVVAPKLKKFRQYTKKKA